MDWITEYIAIADCYAVPSLEGVDAVLCLVGCCDSRKTTPCECFCVPLEDSCENRGGDITRAVRFVLEQAGKQRKVMVHCKAGRSRSVGVVAACLIEQQRLTCDDAVSFISRQRDIGLNDLTEAVIRSIVGLYEGDK